MNPLASLLITLGSEVLLVAGVGIVAERLLPSVRDRRRLWCGILSLIALFTAVELTGLRTEARRAATRWLASAPRSTAPRQFITEVANPAPSLEVNPSLFAVEMPIPAEMPAPSIWPTLLFALWLLGTVCILVRSVCTRWQLRKLVRHSERVDVQAAWEIADRLGLASRRVQLREAAGFGGPVAFGILRPTVLLPRGFANQHADLELKVLLAHELAHLAARDPLWLAISDVLTGLLWWHPAVWWARRRLRATSEAAADEASSLIPGGRIALAEALVAFGHQLTAEASPAGFGVGGLKSELAARVTRLLSTPAHAASRVLTRITLAGTLGTILAISIAPWPGEGAQPVLVAALESIESLEPKPAAANGGATETKSNPGPSKSSLRVVRTEQTIQEPNPSTTRGSLQSIETNRPGDRTLLGYDAKALGNVQFLPANRTPGDGGSSTTAQSEDPGTNQSALRNPSNSTNKLETITLPFLSIPKGPLEVFTTKLQSMIREADPEKKAWRVTVASKDLRTEQPLHMGSAPLPHMLDTVIDSCATPVEWVLEGDEIVFRKIASGKWPLRTRQFHVDAPFFLALIRSRRVKAGDTKTYADVQGEVRAFCVEQGVAIPEFKPTPGTANMAPPQNQSAVFLQQERGILFVRASAPELDRLGRALSLVMSSPIASELETRHVPKPAPSSASVEAQRGPLEHSTYIALRDTDPMKEVHFIRDLRDRLKQAEANLEDLKTKYRERHPKVIEAVQLRRALEAELERATAPSKVAPSFPTPSPNSVKVPASESPTAEPRRIEVEIKFAEVRESNVSGLGLDWIFGNSTNQASVIEAGSAQELEATPAVAQDNRYRVDLQRTIGERAELTPEQFKALLARLEAQAGTELLTAPKVLTSSGRQTKVAVTETKTLVDDVKAVSGSSTNKAAVQYQTRSVDLGPSVEFLPILVGDSLRMHLTAKVTEFLGYDDPKGQSVSAPQPGGKALKGVVPLPHLRIRMAIVDSTFPLGGTLALRGPIATETVRMKDKVPVLGDVPLLGRLFRSESTSTYKKRLYVFVTPVETDATGKPK